jgi:hypothetical protein
MSLYHDFPEVTFEVVFLIYSKGNPDPNANMLKIKRRRALNIFWARNEDHIPCQL